ncbi:unnamed protein product [Malus baccata var. baccata]
MDQKFKISHIETLILCAVSIIGDFIYNVLIYILFVVYEALKKSPQEVHPAATGHELEELAAELEGRDVLEINYPVGPFGTKEAPAIVKSVYDKRIVGCPGIEGGEDEHDVVWFWLEKGKIYECPVCTQVFKLEVVGKGGPPDGHH